MKPKYIMPAVIVLAAALGGVAYYYYGFSKSGGEPKTGAQNQASQGDINSPQPNQQKGFYRDERFKFSFSYPPGVYKLTVDNPDELSKVIVVDPEKPAGKTPDKRGFQVFIMPFDEPGPITKERILIDLPDEAVNDPRSLTINGIEALLFWGHDESMGKTREVWFVHDGYLYQASSYAEFDPDLSKIMATFKFED